MEEHWRAVVGFEGLYEVSNFGRIKSLPRQTIRGRVGGRILTPMRSGPRRYLAVTLCNRGDQTRRYVHHLVLEAFVGPLPLAMEACHYPDPNVENCRLENLRWDTRGGNRLDSQKLGTIARGERHGRAKLSADDVSRVFVLRSQGLTQQDIADLVGVQVMQVNRILNRKNWKHIHA